MPSKQFYDNLAMENGSLKPANQPSRPKYAGVQNMDKASKQIKKVDENGMVSRVLEMMEKRPMAPRDTKFWTPQKLAEQLNAFFRYCAERNLEPSKPLLGVWLSVSNAQLSLWARDDRHPEFRDLILAAFQVMEAIYFSKLDDKPLPNFFKLKTNGFNYVEATKIVVDNDDGVKETDIRELISKAGLDK